MGMMSADAKCVKIEWQTQWFMVDGSLHVLFMCVLFALMVLWAPQNTEGWYSYEDVPNTLAGGKTVESAIWADEDPLDDMDEPSGRTNVSPDTIGASDGRGLE